MKAMIAGAAAGFAATIPMTAAMAVMHRQLPRVEQYPLPPRQITMHLAQVAQAVPEDEGVKQATTLTAHFAYGTAAGAVYAPLAAHCPAHPLVKGISYGLGVWAGSYLGLLPATGLLSSATRHPARRNLVMIAAHVVWGVALGVATEHLQRSVRS